jgi:hypothetical protein
VHCLFPDSFSAVFSLPTAIVLAGELNDIVNPNPIVGRISPHVIFPNSGHGKKRITANITHQSVEQVAFREMREYSLRHLV